MKKVLVFGTFDGLHPGHINYFEQAKRFGDKLIVVVGRDATVRRVKGKLPAIKEDERLGMVKRTGLADEVMLGNFGDPYAIVKQIKPDIIALGYDQTSFTDDLAEELKKAAIPAKIVRLKSYKPEIYKSSRLIKKGAVLPTVPSNKKKILSEGSRYFRSRSSRLQSL